MNWSEEEYVRLYKRDTGDWVMLPWQSKCVLPLLMRKVDPTGRIEVGRAGMRGLAAVLGLPVDVTEAGVQGLKDDGTVTEDASGFVLRNFVEAQNAGRSPAARKREQRLREARSHALSRDVTDAHTEPRQVTDDTVEPEPVTVGHAESQKVPLIAPINTNPPSPPSPEGASSVGVRPLHVRKSEEQFVRQAFADGAAAGGGPKFTLTARDMASLDDAIDANGPHAGAGARTRWAQDRAEAWTRWRLAQPEEERKFLSPTIAGFVKWLNSGAPSPAQPASPLRPDATSRIMGLDGKWIYPGG